MLAASGGSAESLRANTEEIIQLLDLHFDKEEQILFPMVRNMLNEPTLAEIGKQMEAMR